MGSDPNSYAELPSEREPTPKIALTIGEMVGRKWEVRAVCDRCCTYLWMDAKTIIAMSGTDAFFWGRQGTCKVMYGPRRCTGKTRFEAKTPRSDCWYSLNEHVQTARHLFKIRRP